MPREKVFAPAPTLASRVSPMPAGEDRMPPQQPQGLSFQEDGPFRLLETTTAIPERWSQLAFVRATSRFRGCRLTLGLALKGAPTGEPDPSDGHVRRPILGNKALHPDQVTALYGCFGPTAIL